MDTAHLESNIDEATLEMQTIEREGRELGLQVAELIEAFGKRHRCDVTGTLEYVAASLADLISDASGPAYRRKVRLEDAIGRLEDADMRRSSPVVL